MPLTEDRDQFRPKPSVGLVEDRKPTAPSALVEDRVPAKPPEVITSPAGEFAFPASTGGWKREQLTQDAAKAALPREIPRQEAGRAATIGAMGQRGALESTKSIVAPVALLEALGRKAIAAPARWLGNDGPASRLDVVEELGNTPLGVYTQYQQRQQALTDALADYDQREGVDGFLTRGVGAAAESGPAMLLTAGAGGASVVAGKVPEAVTRQALLSGAQATAQSIGAASGPADPATNRELWNALYQGVVEATTTKLSPGGLESFGKAGLLKSAADEAGEGLVAGMAGVAGEKPILEGRSATLGEVAEAGATGAFAEGLMGATVGGAQTIAGLVKPPPKPARVADVKPQTSPAARGPQPDASPALASGAPARPATPVGERTALPGEDAVPAGLGGGKNVFPPARASDLPPPVDGRARGDSTGPGLVESGAAAGAPTKRVIGSNITEVSHAPNPAAEAVRIAEPTPASAKTATISTPAVPAVPRPDEVGGGTEVGRGGRDRRVAVGDRVRATVSKIDHEYNDLGEDPAPMEGRVVGRDDENDITVIEDARGVRGIATEDVEFADTPVAAPVAAKPASTRVPADSPIRLTDGPGLKLRAEAAARGELTAKPAPADDATPIMGNPVIADPDAPAARPTGKPTGKKVVQVKTALGKAVNIHVDPATGGETAGGVYFHGQLDNGKHVVFGRSTTTTSPSKLAKAVTSAGQFRGLDEKGFPVTAWKTAKQEASLPEFDTAEQARAHIEDLKAANAGRTRQRTKPVAQTEESKDQVTDAVTPKDDAPSAIRISKAEGSTVSDRNAPRAQVEADAAVGKYMAAESAVRAVKTELDTARKNGATDEQQDGIIDRLTVAVEKAAGLKAAAATAAEAPAGRTVVSKTETEPTETVETLVKQTKARPTNAGFADILTTGETGQALDALVSDVKRLGSLPDKSKANLKQALHSRLQSAITALGFKRDRITDLRKLAETDAEARALNRMAKQVGLDDRVDGVDEDDVLPAKADDAAPNTATLEGPTPALEDQKAHADILAGLDGNAFYRPEVLVDLILSLLGSRVDSTRAALLRHVAAAASKVDGLLVRAGKTRGAHLGEFTMDSNMVVVDLAKVLASPTGRKTFGDKLVATLTHELVHGVTAHGLRISPIAAARMKALLDAYVEATGDSTSYGTRNIDEFIAEAMSNRTFQTKLAGVKAVGGVNASLWERFVSLVRGILGKAGVTVPSGSLLEQVVSGYEALSADAPRASTVSQRQGGWPLPFEDTTHDPFGALMATVPEHQLIAASTRELTKGDTGRSQTFESSATKIEHLALLNKLSAPARQLGRWLGKQLPAYYLSTKNKQGHQIFQAGRARMTSNQQLLEQADKLAKPYMKLRGESLAKVNDVLETQRLNKKYFTDHELQEKYELSVEEMDGVHVARATTDMLHDAYLDSVWESFGHAPVEIDALKAEIREADGREKFKLAALLDEVTAVQKAKREGYIPFQREGTYAKVGAKIRGERGDEIAHYEFAKDRADHARLVARMQAEYGDKPGFQLIDEPITDRDLDSPVVTEADLRSLATEAGVPQKMVNDFLDSGLDLYFVKQRFQRFMRRAKDTPGYTKDFQKALGLYATSASRAVSGLRFKTATKDAFDSLQSTDKAGFDFWSAWRDHAMSPVRDIPFVKGLTFAHFLAVDGIGAVLNLSQVPLTTAPFLHAMTGSPTVVGKLLPGAWKTLTGAVGNIQNLAKGKSNWLGTVADHVEAGGNSALAEALRHAAEAGVLKNMELSELARASTMGDRGAADLARRTLDLAMRAGGALFQATEKAARTVTFIASFEAARTGKVDWKRARKFGYQGETGNAAQFATFSVDETQGVYGRLNRPALFRDGASLWQKTADATYIFKQYGVNQALFQYKLMKAAGSGDEAAAVALLYVIGSLAALGGIWSVLPFGHLAKNLASAVWTALAGADRDVDAEIRKMGKVGELMAEGALGELPGLAGEYGPGLGRRMGQGNTVPSSAGDLAGPALAAIKAKAEALHAIVAGHDPSDRAKGAAVLVGGQAGEHIVKWLQADERGFETKTGKVLIPASELTAADKVGIAAGAPTQRMLDAQRKNADRQRMAGAVTDLRQGILERGADLLLASDNEGFGTLLTDVADWNSKATAEGRYSEIIDAGSLRQGIKNEIVQRTLGINSPRGVSRKVQLEELTGATEQDDE